MELYLQQNGQKIGPYPRDHIKVLLEQGAIKSTDLVWAEGWGSWMHISEVYGLGTGTTTSTTYSQPSTPAKEGIYAEEKNPVIACVLSLFIVGTGQFYNGDWGKGWFLLITCIIASICSLGTLWFLWALMSVIDAYMVAAKRRPLGGSFFKF